MRPLAFLALVGCADIVDVDFGAFHEADGDADAIWVCDPTIACDSGPMCDCIQLGGE